METCAQCQKWILGALPNPRVSRGVPWVPRIEIRATISDFREILTWKHVHNVKN
jgi:hypothetical protein